MIPSVTDEELQPVIEAHNNFPENKTKGAESIGLAVSTYKYRLKLARRRGLLPPELEVRKTSVLTDEQGQLIQRWDKSALPSMDPDEAVRIPDPRAIVKTSTLYDQEGKVAQQWVQEKPTEVLKAEAWRIYAEELTKSLPRLDPIPPPEHFTEDLMNCCPVGDHHLGMLAWKQETNESYNLEIGERLLVRATDYLMTSAAPAARCLIAFLGDFIHYDGSVPVTPTSRNVLDADSRFPNMIRVAVRCMRYMIEAALRRHAHVHVIIEIGNHDLSSSIFLMECLRNIYENEPRITIDTSPKHYHYYQWGKVLIGTHHGHGSKIENLPLIMATDVPELWGSSPYRYIWTGHVHHDQQKDIQGVRVESFRVLATADAWASQKGYRSQRDMKMITMHKEHGELSRMTVKPQMLEG